MAKVVIDAQTWAEVKDHQGLLELCDQSGQTLAYYRPAFRVGRVVGGEICSPYTGEEIEERRHQGGGRTLAEFWKEHGR